MLALDIIFGSPLIPDLLGIIAGHLYYFLTVLHPLAGGKNILKTPMWVYPSCLLFFKVLSICCCHFKYFYFVLSCRFIYLLFWEAEPNINPILPLQALPSKYTTSCSSISLCSIVGAGPTAVLLFFSQWFLTPFWPKTRSQFCCILNCYFPDIN